MGVKELKIEDLDFTEKKLYSLSDETKTRLKNLNTDITIQLINMSDGNYDYILEYASKYENITDKIIIEEIKDLSERVDIQEKYGIDNTTQLIVIKNGEKEKALTIDDLYTYDYGTSETIDITEEASIEQINTVIDEAFAQINPSSMKEMGLVMKYVTENLANADMTKVSAIVKERLSR